MPIRCSAFLLAVAFGTIMNGAASAGSFEDDLKFLQSQGEMIVLRDGDRQVVVSPKHQARVMTSTPGGGLSCGFINRPAIQAGEAKPAAFFNYGGEDRFWLGPEGGQFALYFAPGAKQELKNWVVPAMFGAGAWTPKSAPTASSVTFERDMSGKNASGFDFDLHVTRTIKLLPQTDVEGMLGSLGDAHWVAFESANAIMNKGREAWTDSTGAVSVWILGMYVAAPEAYVIAPYRADGKGAVVNDEYFGKVPADRLRQLDADHVLVFKADGGKRTKIGLSPERALDRIGAIDLANNVLTVVTFSLKEGERRYVNSMWENPQKAPFGGDVTNSYNDGPKDTGAPSDNFFELETSSRAAFLQPGESLAHLHRTIHVQASPDRLDAMAKRLFGVSLAAVRAAANSKN